MNVKRVRLARVLCPTDFSEYSTYALRHAAAICSRFDARLTVFHVIPLTSQGANMPYSPTLSLVANPDTEKLAASNLREFVERVLGGRANPELALVFGEAWREISRKASSLPADLLVLGTHGRSGFERLMLGSVTEKVVRSVACPVMTVCREEGRTWDAPGLLTRILCATDLAVASSNTINLALSLAAEHQARLTMLHVVDWTDGGPSSADAVDRAMQQLRRATSDEARSWCKVHERVETGRRPYNEILRVAAEERSDLIVIGRHGGNSLGEAFFGSTAQQIVRAATCPVLTVPPLSPS
jgi:nucleotide-binding universal stress UspA family protein